MQIEQVPVIQTCPFQIFVRQRKPERLHEMQRERIAAHKREILPVFPGISGSTKTICMIASYIYIFQFIVPYSRATVNEKSPRGSHDTHGIRLIVAPARRCKIKFHVVERQ